MSTEDPQERPAKRGEAAWKEYRDGVAARNAKVQREGVQQREQDDRRRAALRHAAAMRRDARLDQRHRTP